MLNLSVDMVRNQLIMELLIKKYGIDNKKIISFLKGRISEDEYLIMDEDFIGEVFDFPFEYAQVPYKICEDMAQEHDYYIIAAIKIPGVIPYASHPLFNEFLNNITIVDTYGGGNLIEFYYAPDCLMATNEEVVYQNFTKQQDLFLFGMQDCGALDIEAQVKFLLELSEVNKCFLELFNGKGERTA